MHKGNRRNVVQYVRKIIWGIFAGSVPSARIKGFGLIRTLSESECKEKNRKVEFHGNKYPAAVDSFTRCCLNN